MDRKVITNFGTVDELIPELRVGDIIEFLDFAIGERLKEYRLSPDEMETETLYTSENEWGVYFGELNGDHCIAHYGEEIIMHELSDDVEAGRTSRLQNCLDFMCLPRKPEAVTEIVRNELSVAAAGRLCRLNNSLDLIFKPRSPESITEEIVSIQGGSLRNGSFANSQLFATFCRYRKESPLKLGSHPNLLFQKCEPFAAYFRHYKFYDTLGSRLFPTVMQILHIMKRHARVLHYVFDDRKAALDRSVISKHLALETLRDDPPDFGPGYQTVRAKPKWLNLEEFMWEVGIGDTVEFQRSSYYHCGVYVGRVFGVPMVVHKVQVPKNGSSSAFGWCNPSKSATSYAGQEIRQEPLAAVANDCLCRVGRLENFLITPLPRLEIVGNAFKFLQEGQKKQYNVVFKNCEHFAALCRYGRETSTQIHNIVRVGIIVFAIVIQIIWVWIPTLPTFTFPTFLAIVVHEFYCLFTGHFPTSAWHMVKRLGPAVLVMLYDIIYGEVRAGRTPIFSNNNNNITTF